jgi:hypothetical protein
MTAASASDQGCQSLKGHLFSSDHRSQAMLSPVSTWRGDRLGTPGTVGSTYISKKNPNYMLVCNNFGGARRAFYL